MKPETEKELLRDAQPIVTIFLAINSLKRKVAEKEKTNQNKSAAVKAELKNLKSELKKKNRALAKMDQEKVQKGVKAIWTLLTYNQNLVTYIVKGYSSWKSGVDPKELSSEGPFSLLRAMEKFDLNSKYRFATYAGYWIHQKIQTFLATNQLISQGAGVKEPKNVVYYDPDENRQVDDKDQTYSLIDRLTDEAGDQLIKQEIRSQDTQKQINNLINSLSTREEILITRLYNKIKPRNLIDIYYLAEEEEKSVLQKELTKVINSRKKVIEEEIKEPKIIALVKEKQEGKWIKLTKLDALEEEIKITEVLVKTERKAAEKEKMRKKRTKLQDQKQKIIQEIAKDQVLIIVKKYLDFFNLFKEVKITASGDSDYPVGTIISRQEAEKVNALLIKAEKKPMKVQNREYTIPELARVIDKPESLVSELKKNHVQRLREVFKEKRREAEERRKKFHALSE